MADACSADVISMECCHQDAALQILLWPQQEYHDGRNGEPHTVAPSSVTCEFCQPFGPFSRFAPGDVNIRQPLILH